MLLFHIYSYRLLRLVVRTQDFHSCNRGSIPLGDNNGPLAQLVEQRPFKAEVAGSNPARLISPKYGVI